MSNDCAYSGFRMLSRRAWWSGVLIVAAAAAPLAQTQMPVPAPLVSPELGQPGKDVVWVPSPNETIAMMLDLARVTPDDYVIDLGSGDGRTVIAAAQRGARALGVEYNLDLVALARHEAVRAGVAERARFVEGDMYEADVSEATVLALFLLTENLSELSPRFLTLRPGTRIVSNTFTMPGWTAEATKRLDNCTSWCTALLYVVPANVAGSWRAEGGALALTQDVHTLAGTWSVGGRTLPIEGATVRADQLTFTADGVTYDVRIEGDTMSGTRRDTAGRSAPWRAVRIGKP